MRQFNPEMGALDLGGLGHQQVDLTIVGAHQFLHDRQADAAASRGIGGLAFKFVRLGTYLERADNTARLLDVKYQSLLPRADGLTRSTDFYQWGALLRSVSAFETYRHVYRDVITPYKVAELSLLIFSRPSSTPNQ